MGTEHNWTGQGHSQIPSANLVIATHSPSPPPPSLRQCSENQARTGDKVVQRCHLLEDTKTAGEKVDN